MKWMEVENYPKHQRANIYPKDERGWILPNSQPEILYEIRCVSEINWQEMFQKVIDDLTQTLNEFKARGDK
jgi:hypothetical protein